MISKQYCIEYLRTLRNYDVYQDFIRLMKDFKPEEGTETLKQKMKDLFKGYPDLILGFNAFLPKRHKINIPAVKFQTARTVRAVLSRMRKRDDVNVADAESSDSKLEKVIEFVNKVQDRLCNDDGEEGDAKFQSFLDTFLKNNDCKRTESSPDRKISPSRASTADEVYKVVEEVLKDHPDLIDDFTHFIPTVPRPSLSMLVASSNCQTCTPSYRLLPAIFPIPAPRSELASQVLNDRLVCVRPSKKRDQTESDSRAGKGGKVYKHSIKPNWEDEMCEADRKMYMIGSVSESIKALLEKIEKDSPSEIYIEDHFLELHLSHIKKLYGDQNLKAMDELTKNIRQALPVLLYRLKQEKELVKKELQSLVNQRRAHHMKAICSR